MTQSDLDQIVAELDQIVAALGAPFYADAAFWIGLVVGVIGVVVSAVGLWFSLQAFREARAAKFAARKAGEFVKRQTANVALTGLNQRLIYLKSDFDRTSAWNLMTEAKSVILREIEPYRAEMRYEDRVKELVAALDEAAAVISDFTDVENPTSDNERFNFLLRVQVAKISASLVRFLGSLDNQNLEIHQ